MKTYKATYDGRCKNITYEIGKEYFFHSKIIPCNQGFHSCPNLENVFHYYDLKKEIKIYECDIGIRYIRRNDKIVSSYLKPLREVDISSGRWIRYDDNGNVIYTDDTRLRKWYEYDKNNNCIYYETSLGDKNWKKYDENNNLIYLKTFDTKHYYTYEEYFEYDENNNLIYIKENNNIIKEHKYDENNNRIYSKDKHNYEYWYKYDENNNCIFQTDSFKNTKYRLYDKNNNLIYFNHLNYIEEWWNYDNNNNCISYENSLNRKWKLSILDENDKYKYFLYIKNLLRLNR